MGKRVHQGLEGISVALLVVVLLLCGCAVRSGSGEQTVRVVMDEWTVKPSVSTVSPGRVSFAVVNQGKEEHELVVLKTSLAPTALQVRTNEDKVDEAASGENVGEVEDVEPAKTKTGTFDLSAGRYVLVCNVAGHYRLGMVAAFEVKA